MKNTEEEWETMLTTRTILDLPERKELEAPHTGALCSNPMMQGNIVGICCDTSFVRFSTIKFNSTEQVGPVLLNP